MLTAALSHFTATKPRCATDTFIEELLLQEGGNPDHRENLDKRSGN